MMSKRQQILTEVLTRLAEIATANGFATDAGQLLFVNESPDLGPGDPDAAIAVLVREDVITHQMAKFQIQLPIDLCAIVKVPVAEDGAAATETDPGRPHPWAVTEAAIADIKRAMEIEETPPRSLGGLAAPRFERGTTRPVPRDEGSTSVGAMIRYTVPYLEGWGQP